MYMKLEKQGNPMFHCKPQNDEMLYEEAYAQKRPQPQGSQEMSPQVRLPVCIVNPYKAKLEIFFFEESAFPYICGLDEPIPVRIYDGKLSIDPRHIIRWIKEWDGEEEE